MVETDVNKMKMNEPEYVFLFIKSENNLEESKLVYEAFKNFCMLETKNDYTLGLKRLLEAKQLDWKEGMMFDLINDLERRVQELENKSKEDKKDEVAF